MLSRKDNSEVQNAKIKTIIGKDAVLEGSFRAKETTRVDGVIKGDVEIDEVLVLGTTGRVEGNIRAFTIMIGGSVEGDLIAKEKTVVSATGKVRGNIHTKKLIVDENAVFYGQCFMGEEQKALPQKELEEQPDTQKDSGHPADSGK